MGFKRRESSPGREGALGESCVSVAAELSDSSSRFVFLLPSSFTFSSPRSFFLLSYFCAFFFFFETSEIMERMDR